MEQELAGHLVSAARGFGAARNIELTTVGRLAAGDWRFFTNLEDGSTTFRVRKYDEVMRWFSANWPDGAEWPADVPRPQPEAETAGAAA